MKKLVLMALLSIGLVACGFGGKPTEEEIRVVLLDEIDQKGCTSGFFSNFPISQSVVNNNQRNIQAFAAIGFIKENTDGSYDMTEQGRSAYDSSRQGFCYTESYIVSDVVVVAREKESQLPRGFTDVWYVSFNVSPSNVDEWIKNPQVLAAGSTGPEFIGDANEVKAFTVRVGKKVGNDKLELDFYFSFRP
ncbi:MAG: acyltransferase [Pseudomonadales bacterium]|nr:acyltransferase [Pseudomonadales bacterium]